MNTTPTTDVASRLTVYICAPLKTIDNIELRRQLSEEHQYPCEIVSRPSFNTPPSILLFDTQLLSATQIEYWLERLETRRSAHLCALINVASDSSHEALCNWPQIKGLFYQNITCSDLAAGLQQISDGLLSLPPKINAELIDRYRRAPIRIPTAALDELTRREMDVMEHLHSGLSNEAIANRLFISEHTVKSHLYSAYKKLGISTRLEASNWVRDFLIAGREKRSIRKTH